METRKMFYIVNLERITERSFCLLWLILFKVSKTELVLTANCLLEMMNLNIFRPLQLRVFPNKCVNELFKYRTLCFEFYVASPSQSLEEINVDNFCSGFGLKIRLLIRAPTNLKLVQ